MIRMETEIRHVQSKFPQAGWLGVKLRELVVSRIKRAKPQPSTKEKLSQKFKVTEKGNRNG
jgi:hypothetical protein